uniref:Uncharacterized protein n=1 Tax=Oryzias sinensis TaxID=183150 RepID=A0A8C7Y7H1_9TELE
MTKNFSYELFKQFLRRRKKRHRQIQRIFFSMPVADMAGVFDIDLDQADDNVSDDELEDGVSQVNSVASANAASH